MFKLRHLRVVVKQGQKLTSNRADQRHSVPKVCMLCGYMSRFLFVDRIETNFRREKHLGLDGWTIPPLFTLHHTIAKTHLGLGTDIARSEDTRRPRTPLSLGAWLGGAWSSPGAAFCGGGFGKSSTSNCVLIGHCCLVSLLSPPSLKFPRARRAPDLPKPTT